MWRKKHPTLFGIIVGLGMPLLISSGIILFFAMPNIIAWLGPNPPAPAITYGEFPFRIEYELNGELIVIEDTVICEFDGFELIGPKKIRSWKRRLAGGADEVVLLFNNYNKKIFCNVKWAGYYMGEFGGNIDNERPDVLIEEGSNVRALTASELFDLYGIRLINWEFSPPIVNSFH